MQPLHFVEVHEDGRHLVLADPDAPGTEYLVAIDERLRAAVRTRPPAPEQGTRATTDVSPRRVQAMMRAGQSPEEIAEVTGWEVERVRRFEAPIVAEREHVADLARRAHVRGRAADGSVPTLESRVRERLEARGVDADAARWDAIRPDGGSWTVLVLFAAGGRERSAAWRFDPAGRTLEALDDEARWLSEDEQVLPGGADAVLGGARASGLDLMASVRERSQARGRRSSRRPADPSEPTERRGGRRRITPASIPIAHEPVPDELLPLEDLPYDPDTMGPPPAAGRPEELPAESPEELAAFGPVPGAGGEEPVAEDARSAEDVAAGAVPEPPQDATLDDFFGFDADDAPAEDPGEDTDPVEESAGAEQQDEPEEADGEPTRETEAETQPAPAEDEEPAQEDPPAPRKKGRKGRPSVPSWDDIMFGTRKG